MTMKEKLWIAYWVMGASAILTGIFGGEFWLVEGMAIVGAFFGWLAFFMDS